jgi:hypothetical protein
MSNRPEFLFGNALNTNQFPATQELFSVLSHENEGIFEAHGIGICRANRNGTVTAQYSADGSAWVTAGVLSFAANSSAMLEFGQYFGKFWRAVFDAPTLVGVIKIGKVLKMHQSNYADVTPAPYGQEDSRRPSTMSKGQWLGRHAHGRRASMTYTSTHTSLQWVKENGVELFEALRDGEGVFYRWRPEKYPQDVIYGFLASDIKPTNAGTRDHTEFSIELSGLYDSGRSVYTGPTVIPPGS